MPKLLERVKTLVKRAKPAPVSRVQTGVICMDISGGQRPFVSLGHDVPPPEVPQGFSPVRFSEEEANANPTKRMRRLVKDVLSVGKHRIGSDENGRPLFHDFTESDLQQILANYIQGRNNGLPANLTKSHGNLETLIVPTDEIIVPIDEVVLENGWLWLAVYVNAEEEAYLTNPAMKVSPGLSRFLDGSGNYYPIQLFHVAVTDQPVVTGQGAFIAMANPQGTGASQMDEVILGWFKQIFEYEDKPLPESVTPENAMEIIPVMIESLIGSDVEDPEGDGEETPTEAPAGEVIEPPIAMSNPQLAELTGLVKGLVGRMDRMENAGKKEAFESKARASGRFTEAEVITMTNSAKATGYDTTVLDALGAGKAPVNPPPLGRVARTLSNPQPSGAAAFSDAEVKEAANSITGGRTRKVKPMA